MSKRAPPQTPDGRYIVVAGILWRATRPDLSGDEAARLRQQLGKARSDVAAAKRREDAALLADARRRVNAAKVALGERGPVWWTDGAADFNRRKIENTPYADWWRGRSDAG